MNFLSSHFIIFDFLSSFVNWGDSKECVHSVANRRSFDDDSLSSAYGKNFDFQNFTRIALLQNFGPMTELKLNMAKTEMKTLQTFWELLNSPPRIRGVGTGRVASSYKWKTVAPTTHPNCLRRARLNTNMIWTQPNMKTRDVKTKLLF